MIYLDLAVNDPDNGSDTGYVDGVHFNIPGDVDIALEIDVPTMRCCLLDNNTKLRIGRRIYPLAAYSYWAGNWCWNVAKIEDQTAARIANYLRQRGAHAYSGYETLYAKWHSGKRFTVRDFAAERGE